TGRVKIVLDLADDLPAAAAVSVRLTQAFLNLSLNAIQAMTDGGTGGTGGTLTIRSRPAGGAVRIDFEDTGPGVPAAIQDKIFNFHFTTKKVGNGLGLSITRLILEAQGGSIDFRNQPQGAVFTILLPISTSVAAAR